LDTIQDVYAEQLADLRSAEMQLLDALPKLAPLRVRGEARGHVIAGFAAGFVESERV
jgi:hypothetical protein